MLDLCAGAPEVRFLLSAPRVAYFRTRSSCALRHMFVAPPVVSAHVLRAVFLWLGQVMLGLCGFGMDGSELRKRT